MLPPLSHLFLKVFLPAVNLYLLSKGRDILKRDVGVEIDEGALEQTN